MRFGGQHEVDLHDRLAEFFDLARVGHLLRIVDPQRFAVRGEDLVGDVRRGLHQVEIGFLLQPLLDDLHVQQAQESAAETEAQGIARLGLELEAGIVDAELGQRVAQLFEILAVRRIQPAIDHPLRRVIAGQRRRPLRRPARSRCRRCGPGRAT